MTIRIASFSALVLTASFMVPQALADPAPANPPVTTPQVAQSSADARMAELDFWLSIKASEKAEDYQTYLDKYPNGSFADLARFRLKKYAVPASPPPAPSSAAIADPRLIEIDDWKAIKNTNNIQDYYAYLDKYPDGEFVELAKARIQQMTAAAAPAPTLLISPPAPPTPTAPSEPAASAEPGPAPIDTQPPENPPPASTPPAQSVNAEPAPAPAEAQQPENPPPPPPTPPANAEPAPAPTESRQPENPAPPSTPPAQSVNAEPTPTPTPAEVPQPENPPPVAEPASKAPAPEPTFAATDATLYAKGGGQVRAEPDSKTALLSKLKANTQVHATGRSSDGSWWRVQIAGGQTGYMHKSVVGEKPAAAAPSDQNSAAAAPAVSDAEICPPASEVAASARVSACERLLAKAGSDDKIQFDALIDLGAALQLAGRGDEAIRKFEQAAELKPNNAKVYFRIGMVRLDQRKFPEARAAFEEAAQLDPENAAIVYQRGMAYIGIGDFEQAKLEVKRALLTEENPAYYEKLGEIALALGDLEEAKTALERGRKADPKRKSLILLATNYFTGATDLAAGQGAVVPDDANAALWNAILRKARGDNDGAVQILKSARIDIGKRAWPGPIFDALTGRTSAAKARAAARSKTPNVQFQQLCKLNYFLGEWAYLSGDKDAARDALKAAVDTRAYDMLEYAAAKARLANMGG